MKELVKLIQGVVLDSRDRKAIYGLVFELVPMSGQFDDARAEDIDDAFNEAYDEQFRWECL